jgi:C-terminal processing protease CtpA/Prc
MKRIAILLFASTVAYGSEWARPDANGRCPEEHPVSGDIGITRLVCRGGFCTVNERAAAGSYTHVFSSEPEIAGLASDGPGAVSLREGDLLVAIDGAPITTADGGRRLANMAIGVPTRFAVRRNGRTVDAVIIPVAGCSMPTLTVYGGRAAAAPQSITPPVEFGMQLDCGDCGWRNEHGRRVWRASDFPRVVSVEAGGPAERAGIRRDDVLLRVGDYAIIDSRAGDLLGSLPPGGSVTIQIVRGGEKMNVTLAARRAGARNAP